MAQLTETKFDNITSNDEEKQDVVDAKDSYNVGEVAESSKMKITYLSCENYKSDNQFLQPDDGNKFIELGFEFENLSNSDEHISSLNFECYADDYSAKQSFVGDGESLDATLSPGKKTKGYVYFEVPKKAKSITVEYETSFWTQNKVVFIAK